MPPDPSNMQNGMQSGVGQPMFAQAAGSPFGGQPQGQMPPDPATMQHGMQQGVGQPTFTQAAGSAFGGQPQHPVADVGRVRTESDHFPSSSGAPSEYSSDVATAAATERYSELMRAFQAKQPGSLYEVYTDPMTGKPWWYDLVTGEAVHSCPIGIILRDCSSS